MSGGKFEYQDQNLKYNIFGFTDTYTNVFEDLEISELIWDVLDLIQEFDWYASGDNTEESYLKAKAAFKNKWLADNNEERTKRIIDAELADCKDKLYRTFLSELNK